MPQEKGQPLGPLLLAVMFGVPGAVTWSIATHDSGSFSDDWVLISMPLLLLAALCLAFAGKAVFGLLGFTAGLLAGLGVTAGLFYVLTGTIQERQSYRHEGRRLAMTSTFCEGGAQPFPEAPTFTLGARASMVVYIRRGDSTTRSSSSQFRPWSPSPPHVDQTALIACVQDVDAELEVCRYPGGRTLRRVRRDRRVQLFSLQTGALIAEVALPGSQPDGCGIIEEFAGESSDEVKAGSTPNDETVSTFLRSYIAP
ncbi:MAG: hypothetical protein ACI9KE_004807 [Polyangiales bacterium]